MRRLPFLFGLLTLAGATVFLAVGESIALLLVGRILQGASAAIVWTVGLAVLVDTIGKQKDIGEALGYVSMAMSLGLLIAPLLGGIVFEKAGFYAVFGMCFGLLGVDVTCRLFMIERKVAKKWIPKLDSKMPSRRSSMSASSRRPTDGSRPGSRGSSIDALAQQAPAADPSRSASMLLRNHPAISAGPEGNKTEDGRLGSRAPANQGHNPIAETSTRAGVPRHRRNTPSVAAAASAVLANRSIGGRLPPVLTLLASRRLLAALFGSLVQASLLTAFDTTLPLRVREIFGWGSLGAGLIFLPLVLPTFVSPIVGYGSDRYGPKWFCVAGFLLCCPFLVLLRYVYDNRIEQKVVLCVLLVFLGISLSLAFAPLMAEITYCVEDKERNSPPGTFGKNGAYAQAYALFNVFFAGGCLVGPIWGGMVKEAAGWNTMCWTVGLLSVSAALPCAIWTGGMIGAKWIWRSSNTVSDDFHSDSFDGSFVLDEYRARHAGRVEGDASSEAKVHASDEPETARRRAHSLDTKNSASY